MKRKSNFSAIFVAKNLLEITSWANTIYWRMNFVAKSVTKNLPNKCNWKDIIHPFIIGFFSYWFFSCTSSIYVSNITILSFNDNTIFHNLVNWLRNHYTFRDLHSFCFIRNAYKERFSWLVKYFDKIRKRLEFGSRDDSLQW